MTGSSDLFLLDCRTYEDYLDTFRTIEDRRFLRNTRFIRMLAELGYRSTSPIYSPKEFEQRKAQIHEMLFPSKKASILFSTGLSFRDPVLRELADREKVNKQKILSTIIFIKYRRKNGFEVSGYIDFEESLRQANLRMENATDWSGVFRERVKLRPKPNHLSFYDWHKGIVHYNNSDNYLVLHDVENGLIFMHRGDHKKICVDRSKELYRGNVSRSMIYSDKYGHVIFYDHIIRKKI